MTASKPKQGRYGVVVTESADAQRSEGGDAHVHVVTAPTASSPVTGGWS